MKDYALSSRLVPVPSQRFDDLAHLWEEHAPDVFKITESVTERTARVTFHLQIPALYSRGRVPLNVYFQMSQVSYIVWHARKPPVHGGLLASKPALSEPTTRS